MVVMVMMMVVMMIDWGPVIIPTIVAMMMVMMVDRYRHHELRLLQRRLSPGLSRPHQRQGIGDRLEEIGIGRSVHTALRGG